MNIIKLGVAICIVVIFNACNSNTSTNDFKLKANKLVLNNLDTLNIDVLNPKQHNIKSTTFTIQDRAVQFPLDLNTFKLGKHYIKATIKYNNKEQHANVSVTVVNSKLPKLLDFEIVNTYPHDITSYTQGLEFYNGKLYESTGQYNESKLRIVDYKTGTVEKNINLAPQFFGEGLTIIDNKLHQLTWREGIGFTYDIETLEKLNSFKYGKSKEGWGLCNNGATIFKTDGSERIWLLNPETMAETSYIQAFTNKGKIGSLNEIEWINGKIYANIYQKDGVAIINPKNGAIESVIDFSSLKKQVAQHPKLDVLNGIAYNPDTQTIFVTGKYWDKLFEIKVKK